MRIAPAESKLFLVFLWMALNGGVAVAQTDLPAKLPEKAVDIRIFSGYSSTGLKWSIAGNGDGKNPNIISELIWKNIRSVAAGVGLAYQLSEKLVLDVGLVKSFTQSGKVTDTDYQQDNRQGISFYGHFNSNQGAGTVFTGRFGYKFLEQPAYKITAFIGYGTNHKSFSLLDPTGVYHSGLDSHYKNQWNGPLAALELKLNLSKRLTAAPEICYQQVNYKATGNWNLIEAFAHPISYGHQAKGMRISPALLVSYQLKHHLFIFAKGQYQHLETGRGIDILYLKNGQTVQTQLNQVSQRDYLVTGGIGYAFNAFK